MRLGLQHKVQRLEKIAKISFSTGVAIITPIKSGFIDLSGKKYRTLKEVAASTCIINNIPMPEEMKGGDVD